MRCQCLTAKGVQCKNQAKPGSKFCHVHKNCKKVYVETTSGAIKPMAQPKTTANVDITHDASTLPVKYKSNLLALTRALNDLDLDTYWVDQLPSKYRLKMSDIDAVLKGDKLYVNAPQIYDSWSVLKFGDLISPALFTEFQGDAVTGGGDPWAVSRSGLLKAMHDIYVSATGKPFSTGVKTYLLL